MPKSAIQTTIHGRRLGLGPKSELIFNDGEAGLKDGRIRCLAGAGLDYGERAPPPPSSRLRARQVLRKSLK